jgi:N-acetylmuramoyl-L-alanine amidase
MGWERKKRRKVKTYRYYYTPNLAHGTETFIWAADRSDDKSGTITPDDEFGETDSTITIPEINDPIMKAFQLLYAKKYFESSLHFANLIEAEFVKEGRFSRGVNKEMIRAYGYYKLQVCQVCLLKLVL